MPPIGRITRSEVIQGMIDNTISRMHTSCPGTILTYDKTLQKATVQPILWFKKTNIEDEEIVAYKPCAISNVPVAFPQSTEFGLTFPLEVGDKVLLVFSERSLDEWLLQGKADTEVKSNRKFNLTDAIAIPGISPFSDPIFDLPSDKIYVGRLPRATKENRTRLTINTSNKIWLGDDNYNTLKILNSVIGYLKDAYVIDPQTSALLPLFTTGSNPMSTVMTALANQLATIMET